MHQIFLDFESYYDKQTFSLSSMSTQDYITDPRFEVVGVSIAINDALPTWFPAPVVEAMLRNIDWANAYVVGHNNFFDAAILAWRYGIHPKMLGCSMSLAVATGTQLLANGASLSSIAEFFIRKGVNIPHKGKEVILANGKRYIDFTAQELKDYGRYCSDDVAICRAIFKEMAQYASNEELAWHSTVIQMYTNPVLLIDSDLIRNELVKVQARAEVLRGRLVAMLGVPAAQVPLMLSSNPRFANLLSSLGVKPPMKVSKATGKTTFAFAKSDEEFLALRDHSDEMVVAAIDARLGEKSTTMETRIQTFLKLATKGPLPVPLVISGAHTHRLGGGGGGSTYNLQNLPSGRKEGQSNALRRAIMAPLGYVVVAVDSRQVESRSLAWLANDQNKLNVFRSNGDPYVAAAAILFNKNYDELLAAYLAGDTEAKRLRQVGKSAELGLGFGAGAEGYATYARTQAGMDITDVEAKDVVDRWREANQPTVQLWKQFDRILRLMLAGQAGAFGGPNGDAIHYSGSRTMFGEVVPGIRLGDGQWINYFGLAAEPGEYGLAFTYKAKKFKAMITKNIYGGRGIENIVQGQAFAAMKWQGALLSQKARLLLNVHDEFAFIASEAKAEKAMEFAESCMRQVPPWMEGCPLDGEASFAQRYGDC